MAFIKIIDPDIVGGPHNTIGLRVPAVVHQFMADVQEDQKAGCHADRQAADVQQGVQAVFGQVAEGDFQIVG